MGAPAFLGPLMCPCTVVSLTSSDGFSSDCFGSKYYCRFTGYCHVDFCCLIGVVLADTISLDIVPMI